jgi:hypothetical protein
MRPFERCELRDSQLAANDWTADDFLFASFEKLDLPVCPNVVTVDVVRAVTAQKLLSIAGLLPPMVGGSPGSTPRTMRPLRVRT